jgi:hypothetical protein
VVFDPATVQDHATYERPHQLATGVDDVWVNGVRALRGGEATGAASGRVVRGRAWNAQGGGCRKSAADWRWSSCTRRARRHNAGFRSAACSGGMRRPARVRRNECSSRWAVSCGSRNRSRLR